MTEFSLLLKKKLRCQASVAELPERGNKNEMISVQGHHMDAVLKEIIAQGVPAKSVKTEKRG